MIKLNIISFWFSCTYYFSRHFRISTACSILRDTVTGLRISLSIIQHICIHVVCICMPLHCYNKRQNGSYASMHKARNATEIRTVLLFRFTSRTYAHALYAIIFQLVAGHARHDAHHHARTLGH